MNKSRQINWPNTIFLLATPLIAPFTTYYWWTSENFNNYTLLFFLFMFCACGISITAGYHRLFSHCSYSANAILKTIFLIFGGAAFQGSALTWSLDHRNHHRYVDDPEKDPYAITNGFWFAHIIWLLFKGDEQLRDARNAPDLLNDKLVAFQHKNYIPLASFFCFIAPMGVASLWGDPIGGFFIAGLLRVVLNHQFTFLINSACHVFGSQPYSDSHSARDSWINALVTFGEGYHNFHHEYASDYRNGIRWFDFDPTKWLIYTSYMLGMASNLKTTSVDRILAKKMLIQEKALKDKLSNQPSSMSDFAVRFMERMNKRVQVAIAKFKKTYREYQSLHADNTIDPTKLKLIKIELKDAEEECKKLALMWDAMITNLNKRLVRVRA